SMIRRVTLEGFEPAELPAKLEAGTPPIVSAIGLGVAVDYLQRVGLAAIHEHERLLTERAHEVLENIGGVRILGPVRRRDCQSVRAGARDAERTDWQSVLRHKA